MFPPFKLLIPVLLAVSAIAAPLRELVEARDLTVCLCEHYKFIIVSNPNYLKNPNQSPPEVNEGGGVQHRTRPVPKRTRGKSVGGQSVDGTCFAILVNDCVDLIGILFFLNSLL